MANASPPDLLVSLKNCGLLDQAILERLRSEHPDKSTEEFLQLLLQKKLLTNFQYKQLKAGRTKGFVIGGYIIRDLLGSGGMGQVYRALHSTMNREVALKVLASKHSQDKAALERFYREARATAQLQHPNIIQIFDINQGAGVHFLVMELVEGINLQQVLDKEGAIAYHRAVNMIMQAAKGLKHAHAHRIIHRDIKPANLMMNKHGVIKILDMGLAKSLLNPADKLTGQLDPSGVYGTIDYIAPEQALGQPVDHRCDIYSLGITLFALIVGKVPYGGTTIQKLMSHQMEELPNLGKLRASVPDQLDKIVRKMVAKNPQQRYQSMDEVIIALDPWRTAKPTASLLDAPTLAEPEPGVAATKRLESQSTKRVFKKKKSTKRSKMAHYQLYFVLLVMLVAFGLVGYFVIFSSDIPKSVARTNVAIQNNEVQKTVKIMLAGTNKLIGIRRVDNREVASIMLEDDQNRPSQRWKMKVFSDYVRFFNEETQDTFDVERNRTNDGAAIIGFRDNGQRNQEWIIDGTEKLCKIKSRYSNKNLTYTTAGNFEQYDVADSGNKMEWTIVEVK
jgi:serine/threonine protein kinase